MVRTVRYRCKNQYQGSTKMQITPSETIGFGLHSEIPPSQLIEVCQRAEDSGFHETWVSEDCFFRGGISSAAIALQATQKLTVGIGILAAVTRHPAIAAIEISTLAEAFPGRIRVGFGTGLPLWMQQMGLKTKSPLGALRETLTNVRRLLNGEILKETDGNFIFEDVSIRYPVPDVPLYTGVIGAKGLTLSGEIADGTIISVNAGPKYLVAARDFIAAGQANANRQGTHQLPTYVLCMAAKDRLAARKIARETLGFFFEMGGSSLMTDTYGISEQLTDMLSRGGGKVVAEEMPDEWIDWFAVAGEPDECVERIRALYAAGATSVMLAPYPPGDTLAQIDFIGEAIISRL